MKQGEPEKPIKDLMADCTEATIKDFEFEYQLTRSIAGLNIELFVLIGEESISSELQFSILSLAIKNFRLRQCIGDCTFNGYYETSMSLMRQFYDNVILMDYFINYPKEVNRWIHGKKKIKSRKIRKRLNEGRIIYDFFSDYFVHSNIESISSIVESTKKDKINFLIYPKYDHKKAEYNIHFSILYSWLSNLHLQYSFKDFLWKNEEWKNRFIDWNEIWNKYVEEKIGKESDMKFEFKNKLPT